MLFSINGRNSGWQVLKCFIVIVTDLLRIIKYGELDDALNAKLERLVENHLPIDVRQSYEKRFNENYDIADDNNAPIAWKIYRDISRKLLDTKSDHSGDRNDGNHVKSELQESTDDIILEKIDVTDGIEFYFILMKNS